MGKSARIRAKRDREEREAEIRRQAQTDALEALGYPVEELQKALSDQVSLQMLTEDLSDTLVTGKLVKISVGAGPKVFVQFELDPPERD